MNVDDPELPICKTNACRHAGREKNATTWQRTNLDIRAHSWTVHDTLGVQHSTSNLCCLIFSTILVHLSSFSGTWSNKRKLNTSKMHSLPYWRTKCSMIQTPASAVADHRFSVFTSIYQHLSTVSDQAKTNSLLSISYSKLSLDGSVGICRDLQFEEKTMVFSLFCSNSGILSLASGTQL